MRWKKARSNASTITDDGISPRSIPGMKNGRFCALTNEHEETGLEIEDVPMRKAQMEKRERKLDTLKQDVNNWGLEYNGSDSPDVLFIGMGSTGAQIEEATKELGRQLVVWPPAIPLPVAVPGRGGTQTHSMRRKRVVVVDNNFTGQLQGLIQRELGYHDKLEACRNTMAIRLQYVILLQR